MRCKQPARLSLLVALAVTISGAALLSPASGAPLISDQKANRAVKALVGPDLVRAEIVTFSAGEVGDYWVYRGVVRKLRGRLLTLTQRDGTAAQVRLSQATQIRIDARKGTVKLLRRGMRATFMRKGSAPASWLYVNRRSADLSGPRIRSLLSNDFMGAEVISWTGGAILDSRAYTGVIASTDGSSLTLQENDGTPVDMQIDVSTQVWVNNRAASATDLTAGMRTTTIGNGDGLAGQIWAFGKKLSRGTK